MDSPKEVLRYTLHETDEVANEAVDLVTRYLQSLPETREVEKIPATSPLQIQGDLLWHLRGATDPLYIEVKGDRRFDTGNYFLETVSKVEEGTLGCFLGSLSDIFAYCFVGPPELHWISTRWAKAWFLTHQADFPKARTSTTASDGRILWHTDGQLVQRQRLLREIPAARPIPLHAFRSP